MTSRLALRPDLEECLLEDRTLLAYAPGLQASQFIPSSGFTPSFIVSGFSQGNSGPGSGGSVAPGPQYFYVTIGLYNSSNGGSGGGSGWVTANIYNPGRLAPHRPGAQRRSGPGSTRGKAARSARGTTPP